MKYYLPIVLNIFISLFLFRCSDPCDVPKTDMVIDLDQTVYLKQLAGENLTTGFSRVVDSLSTALQPNDQTLLIDLIEYYEKGGGQERPEELFSCFPSHEKGDFSGLEGFWVTGSDDSFRIATEIMKRRFGAYENICATLTIEKDGFHLQFTDSLRGVGEQLTSIPGQFDILETVNNNQLSDFFLLADSLLAASDSSQGQSITFQGLFNPDVLPNPLSPILGETTVADSGKIGPVIRHPEIQGFLEAREMDLLWTKADAMIGGDRREAGLQLVAVKNNTSGQAIGIHIREAFVGGIEGKPAVRISLNAAGAQTLRALTEKNRRRSLAMVLDGVVWQLAKVREPLIDGKFELTGGLSQEQSKILVAVLGSGALPVPVVLEQ